VRSSPPDLTYPVAPTTDTSRVLICTLGDLLLDVVVRLDAPLEPGSDAPARTSLSTGGQAANVAAWAVALGAQARVVCRRGTGGAAILAEQGLRARGVELVGPQSEEEGGVVVSLVDVDGDRTMASDRGASPGLRAADIEPSWFARAGALHLSGYSLLREPIAGAARHAAVLARAVGARVSVDLAAAPLIAAHGSARFRAELAELAPDVVFATVAEEHAVGGPLDVPIWVRKRGPEGCEALFGDERVALPIVPGNVVDSTGAGDALAAGFLIGGDPRTALQHGLAAAACCVATTGAMPPENRFQT
jgi:sugar/nucleoside kinase (ribokinase family)